MYSGWKSSSQGPWFKVNSTLPVGRHVVDSSGALILQDIRPEDEGQYTCKAENLMGTINASARLTVQCKLHFILQDFKTLFLSLPNTFSDML